MDAVKHILAVFSIAPVDSQSYVVGFVVFKCVLEFHAGRHFEPVLNPTVLPVDTPVSVWKRDKYELKIPSLSFI